MNKLQSKNYKPASRYANDTCLAHEQAAIENYKPASRYAK